MESRHLTTNEIHRRRDLAALFRYLAFLGWDDLIYTHCSCRIGESSMLVNPNGWAFDEITASSLQKVSLYEPLEASSNEKVNPTATSIHKAIYQKRKDVNFIIHLHTDYGVAVSMQEQGLIPASQYAVLSHFQLAYHDFGGLVLDAPEEEQMVKNLGNKKLMLLRNHGTLALGSDIGQTFEAMYFLERACRFQILAQSGGQKLVPISQEAYYKTLAGAVRVNQSQAEANAWQAILRKVERLDPYYKE